MVERRGGGSQPLVSWSKGHLFLRILCAYSWDFRSTLLGCKLPFVDDDQGNMSIGGVGETVDECKAQAGWQPPERLVAGKLPGFYPLLSTMPAVQCACARVGRLARVHMLPIPSSYHHHQHHHLHENHRQKSSSLIFICLHKETQTHTFKFCLKTRECWHLEWF